MKKYCSVCKRPLADPNAFICDKCGKPTKPLDIFNRLASDNFLSSKEKSLLEFIGFMNILSCVISMFEWIVIISICAHSDSVLAAQWEAGLVVQTTDNIARYQTARLLYKTLTVIGTVYIFEQLGSLFFAVMILLKKVWAVQVSRVLYIINAVLYLISGNIISFVIVLSLALKLKSIISKMEGGSEYNARRAEEAIRAAEIAGDKNVWQCKSCGYVNPVSASECKSCGKWKG